jgi:hypothetical protein
LKWPCFLHRESAAKRSAPIGCPVEIIDGHRFIHENCSIIRRGIALEIGGRQVGTVLKRIIPDVCDAIRDGDIGQVGAIVKRLLADTYDGIAVISTTSLVPVYALMVSESSFVVKVNWA